MATLGLILIKTIELIFRPIYGNVSQNWFYFYIGLAFEWFLWEI